MHLGTDAVASVTSSSTPITALDKHTAYLALASAHNLILLALSAGIAYLLDVPGTSWKNHASDQTHITAPPKPMTDYVSRIQHLYDDATDPAPLLMHLYVHYEGDRWGRLSGGGPSNLTAWLRTGTQSHKFMQLGGTKGASVGDTRKVKDCFRRGARLFLSLRLYVGLR